MNDDQKKEFLESTIVQNTCPKLLAWFSLAYYTSYFIIFFFRCIIYRISSDKEKTECQALFNWNLATTFMCLAMSVLTYFQKISRMLLDLQGHKLVIIRIIAGSIVSSIFIIGLAVNRYDESHKECNEFNYLDTAFICTEATANVVLVMLLIYSFYYYFYYKPTPIEKKKVIKHQIPRAETPKNYELLPLERERRGV